MAIRPGLMSYSYHHCFGQGAMTPEGLIARCMELGLRSLEWCHFPCHEPGAVDWEQVRTLDRLGREHGIENSVAGFAPLLAEGRDNTAPESAERTLAAGSAEFLASVLGDVPIAPRETMLEANFPNPFQQETRIRNLHPDLGDPGLRVDHGIDEVDTSAVASSRERLNSELHPVPHADPGKIIFISLQHDPDTVQIDYLEKRTAFLYIISQRYMAFCDGT